jgi:hypothetical protein
LQGKSQPAWQGGYIRANAGASQSSRGNVHPRIVTASLSQAAHDRSSRVSCCEKDDYAEDQCNDFDEI